MEFESFYYHSNGFFNDFNFRWKIHFIWRLESMRDPQKQPKSPFLAFSGVPKPMTQILWATFVSNFQNLIFICKTYPNFQKIEDVECPQQQQRQTTTNSPLKNPYGVLLIMIIIMLLIFNVILVTYIYYSSRTYILLFENP